jgi:YegS/Rv2252/BmrU family lipid kinase
MNGNPPRENGECSDRKASLQRVIRREGRAVLLVNTLSRNGEALYSQAKRLLTERGLKLDSAYPARDPARLPEMVVAAVRQGHTFIIIGGGDGTISLIADALAYKDVVLGILPSGTANSFARTIGIPLSLVDAVDVLVGGKVVDIDLGKINDDYFANAAAIGLPASIGRSIPQNLKKWFGRVGYLLVGGAQLRQHRSFRCTLTHEGRKISHQAVEVRIANGKYQGGVLVAEQASLESRDLVVQIIKGASNWALVKVWARAVLGLQPSSRDVEIVRGRDLVIDAHPQQHVSIDGEAVTRTPIRATVARQALLVMVPRDREDVW